jgi:hypothetical protein
MPRSEGAADPVEPPNLLVHALAVLGVPDALYRAERKRLDDVGIVRVVVVRQSEFQLQAARANQLAQTLEARGDETRLPAGNCRLGGLRSPRQLSLRKAGPKPGFSEEVSADYISSIDEIADMRSLARGFAAGQDAQRRRERDGRGRPAAA